MLEWSKTKIEKLPMLKNNKLIKKIIKILNEINFWLIINNYIIPIAIIIASIFMKITPVYAFAYWDFPLEKDVAAQSWGDKPSFMSESLPGKEEKEDTESDSSSSEDDNDEELPLFNKYQQVIDYYSELIKDVELPEGAKLSLDYVKHIIPEDMWAKSELDISNNQSNINQYMALFFKNVEVNSDEDFLVLIHFEAAINTYNSAQVLDLLDNSKFLEKMYQDNVDRIIEFYNKQSQQDE